jgi:hypothetical protein
MEDSMFTLAWTGRARCDPHHRAAGTIRRSLAPLTVLQERQERISCDSSRSNQGRNNVSPNLIVLWDDQRPGDAGFFQFDVATLLACLPIANLFKHANEFVPRERI